MRKWMVRFWREDEGQDLIEYSLLITFIAIATMWLLGSGRPMVNSIWQSANSDITQAGVAAGS